MTDFSEWKVLKSVIEYRGDDAEKQAQAKAAQAEYAEVAEWCNDNQQYTIDSDDTYYFTVALPEPLPPTKEQVREMRAAYRRTHIDDQTAERSRKMANNTWTEDDETAYLALDAEVTAYVEEHYPYPDEADENS